LTHGVEYVKCTELAIKNVHFSIHHTDATTEDEMVSTKMFRIFTRTHQEMR